MYSCIFISFVEYSNSSPVVFRDGYIAYASALSIVDHKVKIIACSKFYLFWKFLLPMPLCTWKFFWCMPPCKRNQIISNQYNNPKPFLGLVVPSEQLITAPLFDSKISNQVKSKWKFWFFSFPLEMALRHSRHIPFIQFFLRPFAQT